MRATAVGLLGRLPRYVTEACLGNDSLRFAIGKDLGHLAPVRCQFSRVTLKPLRWQVACVTMNSYWFEQMSATLLCLPRPRSRKARTNWFACAFSSPKMDCPGGAMMALRYGHAAGCGHLS